MVYEEFIDKAKVYDFKIKIAKKINYKGLVKWDSKKYRSKVCDAFQPYRDEDYYC